LSDHLPELLAAVEQESEEGLFIDLTLAAAVDSVYSFGYNHFGQNVELGLTACFEQ